MLAVLLLFLIPLGCGIPAGVLLARSHNIGWMTMTVLYFIADVMLVVLFEPVLRLFIWLGRKIPPFVRAADAMRSALTKNSALYGGAGSGSVALILIAFGVDPMTGRAAAAAAGHGFVAGWTFAFVGDMLAFFVVMATTLKLNSVIGDPTKTIAAVMAVMIFLPILAHHLKKKN